MPRAAQPGPPGVIGGSPQCAHMWRMVEDGYTRVWHGISFDPENGRILPGGGGEFTDDGDGQLYIECDCGARADVDYEGVSWLG